MYIQLSYGITLNEAAENAQTVQVKNQYLELLHTATQKPAAVG